MKKKVLQMLSLRIARCFSHSISPKMEAPKPFTEIPGSRGLPIVGNVPRILREVKSGRAGKEHWFYKLHSQYGSIYKLKLLGNRWIVYTASPEALEAIFRHEGKCPSRGNHEDNMMWLYNELGVPPPMFLSNGDVWKKTRSYAAKQVVPRRVANFVKPLCEIAEQLITHLGTLKDKSGDVADISPTLHKWAFQGVSYFVYNEDIDVYSESDPVWHEFVEAAVAYIDSIVRTATALPLYKLYKNKTYREYEKVLRRVQRVGTEILQHRYQEIKNSISSGTVDETKAVGLMDQWLIEGKFSHEEALSLSFDMLSAGIDTTANTSSFLLYELAKKPNLQEQLVHEVTSIVGDKTHPSWEDLQRTTLLRNCVKETMRLYPPTRFAGRILAEDAVVLGYHIPAGTSLAADMGIMSRSSQLFEDPDEFRPERWSKEASEKIHPFSSLPFGFGPRSCYGRRLAELELYILLAKMLPKYQITTNVKEMKVKKLTVLKPNVPIHINIKLR